VRGWEAWTTSWRRYLRSSGPRAAAAGFLLTVHPGTLDVTVEVQLRPGRAAPVTDFTGTLREVLEVLTAGLLARKR
jgi:hypothetical protein